MINLTKRRRMYHADGTVGGQRLRGSLGTSDSKAATKLVRKLDDALASGPKAEVWQDLRLVLPPATYQTFSGGRVAKPLTPYEVQKAYSMRLNRRAALGEIATSTQTRYENSSDDFFDWLNHETGVRLLDGITPTMIEEYRAYRLEQTLARKQSRGGQGLDVDVVVLKQIFDLAIELGYSKPNPVKSVSRTKVRSVRGAEPFTPEELGDLTLYLTVHGTDTERLVFELLRWTGMRGSDVCGLRWADVSLSEQTIRLTTQKRGTEVVIPVHKHLSGVLCGLYRRATDNGLEPGQWALVLSGMTRPQLYRLVKKLGEKAGVPNATPHKFRSSLAVEILQKGGTIYDVAKILGDTVAVCERHYTPFVDNLQEKVRNILERD